MKLTDLPDDEIVCLVNTEIKNFAGSIFFLTAKQAKKDILRLKRWYPAIYTARKALIGKVQCIVSDQLDIAALLNSFRVFPSKKAWEPINSKDTEMLEASIAKAISQWIVDNDLAYEEGMLELDVDDLFKQRDGETTCEPQ